MFGDEAEKGDLIKIIHDVSTPTQWVGLLAVVSDIELPRRTYPIEFRLLRSYDSVGHVAQSEVRVLIKHFDLLMGDTGA